MLKKFSAAYVLAFLFLASLLGHLYFERKDWFDQAEDHGEKNIDEPLTDADFWETFARAVFENWQSEFLQILAAAWVFKHFFWEGSPESKDPE